MTDDHTTVPHYYYLKTEDRKLHVCADNAELQSLLSLIEARLIGKLTH